MDSHSLAAVRRVSSPRLMSWRRSTWWIRIGLMAAVIGLLGATVAWVVDHSALTHAFATVGNRPWLVVGFVIGYTAAFWLRAEAWRLLLPGLGRIASYSALQTSLFANHLLPVKAGEIARPYVATARGIPAPRAVSTSLVARLLDYLVLFFLAAVLIPFAPSSPVGGDAGLLVSGLFLALGAGSVVALRRLPVPERVPAAARPLWTSLKQSLDEISTRQAVGALLLTIPAWMLESVALLATVHAVGGDISVQAAIAVTSFTLLFQVFHFAPGGIGVYEASMTGALGLYGFSVEDALMIAVVTHGLKFGYSYTFAAVFAAYEVFRALPFGKSSVADADGECDGHASRLEIVAARAWNVLNEGKPFTPVFAANTLLFLSIPSLADAGYWVRAAIAGIAIIPLGVVFYRFDFPLWLRTALWSFLFLFIALFKTADLVAVGVSLGLYLGFTIILWGSVYYHLRIGMPWTNFTRFWRLVLENPDPTSGNFLEQTPKFLLMILMFGYVMDGPSIASVAAVEGFILFVGIAALLLHQWFFTWVPALPSTPLRGTGPTPSRSARRVIAIVIDGCRADRLREAHTPFIDSLRHEGTEYTDMRTVYPARTVTAFSSMLTGAPPAVHGMKSNFVPNLGVKCESVFDVLEQGGEKGRLVGIAHLVDAFGEDRVSTVSAVNHNDEIDHALVRQAKRVMREEDPDLLVLQLLSVDQTGHARGSYNREYLDKIEITDRIIEDFVGWCEREGYMDDATLVISSDHGQGIGIGGHGHLTESERRVPCIFQGTGVQKGRVVGETRHLTDVAPTLLHLLGKRPPVQSVGRDLLDSTNDAEVSDGPVAVLIPAFNEAANLPGTLSRVPRTEVPDLHVIVVDDGSSDDTAAVARRCGAETVVRHERNRGLGAALRTALHTARDMNARAAVYLDADGEYDPVEISLLLADIEAGRADYVLGTRGRGGSEGQRIGRYLGNRVFTALLNLAAGRRIRDGQTGFRAFSRRAIQVAEISHDYNYAQVLTLDLLRKGMRMSEVPITWRRRRRGNSFIGWQYLWRVPVGMARELWTA